VRLYSRPGNDLTRRFPLIVETLARLRSRSCIIDGEAVACDDNGVASFDLIRHHRANDSVFLSAFDLVELNGDDLCRDPLEVRKATLASVLAKASSGIRFNEHIEGDGPTVFAHACKMGLEGIVSKRKGSAYRSGRSPDWLKMKNADAPAVKREEGRMGQNRIMIYGPKADGTYIVEFKTAAGEALAISIPRTETALLRQFRTGLFVPEADARAIE
jgi:ATP-dependent DNA ligase